ncbi:MAG: hypothetical protein ACE5F2_00075 [Candidatus Paceibacteria bacterium]
MKKPIMIIMLIIVIASAFFAYQGVQMHNEVAVEEAKFHALQESYFSNSKAVRDAAESNSELTQDLVAIANYPSTLLELKLVGIGKILTGIFIVLFCILLALIIMPMRLGSIIRENKGQ